MKNLFAKAVILIITLAVFLPFNNVIGQSILIDDFSTFFEKKDGEMLSPSSILVQTALRGENVVQDRSQKSFLATDDASGMRSLYVPLQGRNLTMLFCLYAPDSKDYPFEKMIIEIVTKGGTGPTAGARQTSTAGGGTAYQFNFRTTSGRVVQEATLDADGNVLYFKDYPGSARGSYSDCVDACYDGAKKGFPTWLKIACDAPFVSQISCWGGTTLGCIARCAAKGY